MGIRTFCNVMVGRVAGSLSGRSPVELDRVVAEAKVAFDAGCRSLVGSTYAPNRVTVRFSAEDAEYHAPLMKRFRGHVATVLRERVERRELDLLDHGLEVRFEQSDDVPVGTVDIETEFVSGADERDETVGPQQVLCALAEVDEDELANELNGARAGAADEEADERANAGAEAGADVDGSTTVAVAEADAVPGAEVVDEPPRASFRVFSGYGRSPDDDRRRAIGRRDDDGGATRGEDEDPDAQATRLAADHGTRCVAERAIFEVIGGPNRGALHVLGDGIHVIGRGRGCEIALPAIDDLSSRRHARVIVRGGVVAIDDLQSGNGTQVNGTRVEHAELRVGDVVRAGRTNLRMVQQPGAEA